MGSFDAWLTKFKQLCKRAAYKDSVRLVLLINKLTPTVLAKIEELGEDKIK